MIEIRIDGKRYYTPEQVSIITQRPKTTIRVMASRYGLGTKIGHDKFYSEEDIRALELHRRAK